jgi:hypothetical protein
LLQQLDVLDNGLAQPPAEDRSSHAHPGVALALTLADVRKAIGCTGIKQESIGAWR